MTPTLRKIILTILAIFFGLSSQAQLEEVTTLTADGPGDTYDLIQSTFNPGNRSLSYEIPDTFHNPPVAHITEVFDNEINKYVFKFDMHLEQDGEIVSNSQDRQRNEIKVHAPSPEKLKAKQGDTLTYEWKFKLDSLFQPSGGFTHFVQFKAVGGQSGPPLLTLSPRKKKSGDFMELIHRGNIEDGEVSGNLRLRSLDLAPFLGKWLAVTCTIHINGSSTEIAVNKDGAYTDFPTPGFMDFEISEVHTGNILMSYSSDDIDTDRNERKGKAFQFIRPKWGIYRSLNDRINLRDETVYFADFVITKKSKPIIIPEPEPVDNTGLFTPNPVIDFIIFDDKFTGYKFEIFNLSGRKVKASTRLKINLSSLSPGAYIVKATKDAVENTFNIIKK